MMKIKKQEVKRLQAQQEALINNGYVGGIKAHKKRIQEEYRKEMKRIKLYKSRKIQKRALKTKKLKKRKPRKTRRRKDIINRINVLFR